MRNRCDARKTELPPSSTAGTAAAQPSSRKPRAAITPTTTQSTHPYTAYHIASCDALTGGLKITSAPVELTCINCASSTLFVLMYNHAISTRMAVIAKANPRKKWNQYWPCGAAAPRKLIAGRCHAAQSTPSTMAARKRLPLALIFGNAKPVQPISSRKPAGTPNKMPGQNRLGANPGDTNVLSDNSTARTSNGGITKTLYQRAGAVAGPIRANRAFIPSRPWTIRVITIPLTLGPNSIAGNIRIPLSRETACRAAAPEPRPPAPPPTKSQMPLGNRQVQLVAERRFHSKPQPPGHS